MGYRIVVAGATGNVGREVLAILAEREFPYDELAAVASSRSQGLDIEIGDTGRTVEIIVLSDAGYRVALMREYRGELLGAVLCGAIVAAALGFVLARAWSHRMNVEVAP